MSRTADIGEFDAGARSAPCDVHTNDFHDGRFDHLSSVHRVLPCIVSERYKRSLTFSVDGEAIAIVRRLHFADQEFGCFLHRGRFLVLNLTPAPSPFSATKMTPARISPFFLRLNRRHRELGASPGLRCRLRATSQPHPRLPAIS